MTTWLSKQDASPSRPEPDNDRRMSGDAGRPHPADAPINAFGDAVATSRRTAMSGGATWQVPEEIPVAMSYNGRNYAVMLATPDNLDDFATGFSLTEQVLEKPSDAFRIDIHHHQYGADIRMSIAPERLELLDIRQKRRNLVGRSGCGLCGLESADGFFTALPRVGAVKASAPEEALRRALAQLEAHQPLNRQTRTVHAAAFAAPDGNIIMAREDIGRHNALDKLMGALSRAGICAGDGFVLMSSRCSYEIVEKSARCGVKVIAAISGPTAFAIRKAKEANIALYCRSGEHFLETGNLM